jgi:hypothetical protein
MPGAMFEARHISAAPGGSRDGAAVRVPQWEELVARLAAARDLRRSLGDATRARGGGFARFAQPHRQAVNTCEGEINQPGLADGRGGAGIVGAATAEAASAHRDMQ